MHLFGFAVATDATVMPGKRVTVVEFDQSMMTKGRTVVVAEVLCFGEMQRTVVLDSMDRHLVATMGHSEVVDLQRNCHCRNEAVKLGCHVHFQEYGPFGVM